MNEARNRRRSQLCYALILGFAGFTALLLAVHGGSVVNYAFPVLAFAVAGAVLMLRPNVYCAFVWWIWIFTPLVRRLVDYQTSYHDISPVMLTPLLVTGYTALSQLRHIRFILRRDMLPIFLILLVITYAFFVGVLVNGAPAAGFEYLTWLLPITFGVYMLRQREQFDEIRKTFIFANNLGLLLIGAYGIYQFFRMPPWDAYWLQASKVTAIGAGTAEAVRIWSTMNSPGPYAFALAQSLILIFVSKGFLRLAAGGIGFPAFGLSLVRSAWACWALAVAYIVFRARAKTRIRVVAAAIIVVVVSIPLVTAGPVADQVAARLSTFGNLSQDNSYKARKQIYSTTALDAFMQPIGVGFGQIGVSGKLSAGHTIVFDAGALQAPLEFGWVGALLFGYAIIVLSLRVLGSTLKSRDPIAIAGGGLFLAMILENLLNSDFTSTLGISIWVSYAFAMGMAPAYAREKSSRRIEPLRSPPLAAE